MLSRLGRSGDAGFHLRPGVEVRSDGDLTLTAAWDLFPLRHQGEPGVLTLRAKGDLSLNANLSDAVKRTGTSVPMTSCRQVNPGPIGWSPAPIPTQPARWAQCPVTVT